MSPGEDMTQDVTYFCVARGCDHVGWQAICLNLDIAVEGKTFLEAKMNLNAAVASYVEEAMKLPEVDRNKLLHRQVPFALRLQIAFKLFWHSFRNKRRDGRLQASFDIPCHA